MTGLTLNKSDIGVIKIPKKLPTTELKIAAASLPCAAFVKMTLLETGGGMHATVSSLENKYEWTKRPETLPISYPFKIHPLRLNKFRIRTTTWNVTGMITNVNICMYRCRRYCRIVWDMLSDLIERPLMRNMSETAPYFTVTSGRSGPRKRYGFFRVVLVVSRTFFRSELGMYRSQNDACQYSDQEPVFSYLVDYVRLASHFVWFLIVLDLVLGWHFEMFDVWRFRKVVSCETGFSCHLLPQMPRAVTAVISFSSILRFKKNINKSLEKLHCMRYKTIKKPKDLRE